jgi:hypothetical protein
MIEYPRQLSGSEKQKSYCAFWYSINGPACFAGVDIGCRLDDGLV